MYEVKPINKKINRNNFCGARKKWGIFFCDFFEKMRIVHVCLLDTLEYLE